MATFTTVYLEFHTPLFFPKENANSTPHSFFPKEKANSTLPLFFPKEKVKIDRQTDTEN